MKKIISLLAALLFTGSIAFASSIQDPITSVSGNAATATALAADPANCGAGQAAGGINASGTAEGCLTPVTAEADTLATVTARGALTTVSSLFQNAVAAEFGKDVAGGTTNVPGAVKIWSDGDNAYSVTLQAGTVVVESWTMTLPLVHGASGQFLQTDGTGITTWATETDPAITAGDYLTRTGVDIDLDAEIYTKVASVCIAEPADTMDALVQMTFPTAVTITAVACSTDTGTADIQFDERAVATPNTAGTDVLSNALQCDNNAASTTAFANATIAADVPLSMDIDAVASTPTKLRIYVKYTIDE
jgi:hypothetical protein